MRNQAFSPPGVAPVRRWLIAAVAAVLCVGAGIIVWSPRARGGPRTTAVAADNQELEQLRVEVHALRGQVGALALNAGVSASAARQAPAEPATAPAKEQRLTEEQIQEREAAHSGRVASYADAYLEREAQDPAWGAAREREIRDEFKGVSVPGFALRAADCRATICRLVIDRRPEGVTQELGPAVSELPAFRKMGAFFHYEDDKVTVYAPREGHPFPNDPALTSERRQGQEGRSQ
jgi:hypothetical protein